MRYGSKVCSYFYMMHVYSASYKQRRLNAYKKRKVYVIMCAYERKSSTHFVPTSAPAPTVTLLLNMYNDIHIPALQELDCALAHVLDVCGLCCDDMDDS